MKQLLKRATALVDLPPQPRADRFGRTGAAERDAQTARNQELTFL